MAPWTKWMILYSIVNTSTVSSIVHRTETSSTKDITQNAIQNEDSKFPTVVGVELTDQKTLEELNESMEHDFVMEPTVARDNVELTDQKTLEALNESMEHDFVMEPTVARDNVELTDQKTLEELNESMEHDFVMEPTFARDNVELTDQKTLEELNESMEHDFAMEPTFARDNVELTDQKTLEELNESMEHDHALDPFFARDNSSLEFYDGYDVNETEEWENYTMFVVDMSTNTTYKFREGDDIQQALIDLRANGEKEKPTVTVTPPTVGDFDILKPVKDFTRINYCPRDVCPSDQHSYDRNYCCMRCKCQYRPSCPSWLCCYSVSTNLFHHAEYVEECVHPSIGDREMFIGSFAVLLTQSCKLNDNAEITKMCQQTDNGVIGLDQLIPVRSQRTGIVYKNIYCAECNDEKGGGMFGWQLTPVQPLESHLICENANLLIKTLQRILHDTGNIVDILNATKGCYLHWNTDSKPFKCIKINNVLDRCLDPNFKDKKIKSSCRRESYSPVKGLFGIYSNVFCLVCNEGLRSLNETCKKPFSDIHESFYDIRQSAYRVTLRLPKNVADVIAARATSGLQLPAKSIENNKREKMCPLTTVKIGDTCEMVIQDVRGIGLDYRFRMVYSIQEESVMTNDYILSSVRYFTQGGDNTTEICKERVIDRYVEDSKLIVVLQVTRLAKQFVDIKAEYDSFINRLNLYNQDAVASAKTTMLSAELVSDPLKMVGDGSVSFAVYTDSHVSPGCGISVAMTDMQFCGTFLFQDVVQHHNDMIEVDGVSFVAGEYIQYPGLNASVLICRQEYDTQRMFFQMLVADSSTASRIVPIATSAFVSIVCLISIMKF